KLQAKKPDDRFQSAREVADVLADCEGRLKANAKLTDFPRIPRGKSVVGRTGRWKWVAAAALLLSVLALALTEIAGLTHWLQNQQPTSDRPNDGGGGLASDERPGDKGPPADYTNTLGMKFMLIPAGKFTMGSSQEEIDHFVGIVEDEWYKRALQAEGPEHEVEITKPFCMGTTEVTVGQFRRFIEANPKYKVGDARWKNPGFGQTDNHPVV